jgi:hypothetical protein
VFIIADNDWRNRAHRKKGKWRHRNTYQAVIALVKALREKSAEVKIVSLPVPGPKGYDDFRLEHSLDEFHTLPFDDEKEDSHIRKALETVTGRERDYEPLLAEIAAISDAISKEMLIKQISIRLGVSLAAIRAEMVKILNQMNEKGEEDSKKKAAEGEETFKFILTKDGKVRACTTNAIAALKKIGFDKASSFQRADTGRGISWIPRLDPADG